MNHEQIFLILLSLFSLIAIYLDIKTKKIPNSFNVPVLIILLFYYNFFIAPIEFGYLFIWWGFAFLLWILRVLGGGDAKMLFWLGIGLSRSEYIPTLIGIILLGGVFVVITALVSGSLRAVIINIKDVLLRKKNRSTKTHKTVFSPVLVAAVAISHFKGWETIFASWTNYR